jgi:hypothetical protein
LSAIKQSSDAFLEAQMRWIFIEVVLSVRLIVEFDDEAMRDASLVTAQ